MLMHRSLSKGWCHAYFYFFLVSLYVLVDDWWKLEPLRSSPIAAVRLFHRPDVITLASSPVAPFQKRARFLARAPHTLAPTSDLCSRASSTGGRPWSPIATSAYGGPIAVGFRSSTAGHPSPAIVRVGLLARRCAGRPPRGSAPRPSGFTGQVAFGQPGGRDLRLRAGGGGLRPRPIGEHLIEDSPRPTWPTRAVRAQWSDAGWIHGALVAATQRQLQEGVDENGPSLGVGKATDHEGVIDQLKDLFALERHRAKTLGGLLAAWRPRWLPTPAGSSSTSSSGDRCATWPTFWSERLCISRLALMARLA